MNVVLEGFLKTSIPLDTIFYAEERVSRFSLKNFMSQTAEKICRGTLRCFRKLRVSKNFVHKRGISRFSVESFLFESTKKVRRGTVLRFRKIGVSKSFRHKGEGNITVFRRNSAIKFRREILLCFRKFRVSKSYMDKKSISWFSIENFLSHSIENLRRGTLLCFRNFWYRKLSSLREGGVTIFRSNKKIKKYW